MRTRFLFLLIVCVTAVCISGCSISDKKAAMVNGEILEESPSSGAGQEENQIEKNGDETVDGNAEEKLQEEIEQYLERMTLEEKVAQLFIVLPESLVQDVDCVTAAGSATQSAINEVPVGGFVYLSNNLNSYDQVKTMLGSVQTFSRERIGLPMFLCVDEEGGTVARVGGSGNFDVEQFEAMSEVGKREDPDEAFRIGETIGGYLYDMGFNTDFAPVADVLTNSENQVVRERAFGSNPEIVAVMSDAFARGLASQHVLGTYKHFPGHGDTAGDTHNGYAYSDKSREELYECELIPFMRGAANGIPFIMVGHISFPNIIGDDTPASLSPIIINGILREEIQYEGIIITDALNMGAIAQQYTPSEAAVKAIQAGVDILLMPDNFNEAYSGVISAVNEGVISMERIDESLVRIIKAKIKLSDGS